ncbi:mannan endo-1,4-beta-mannosidase 2-like [Phalaenopsis equestris]|uniref:mannan endo-1,4-beta-mannosidase 2-like n=1 Tax=Phalaenopsis equestris TaxID=78828 RepID=UPI0009E27150|nr:mannan endo-1,4-beta-mannosidase 2-like [Phalaenopsis equestris]
MDVFLSERITKKGLLYPIIGLVVCMTVINISFGGFGTHDKESQKRFVRTEGTQFIINGEPFYVNGWNSYWLLTQSVEERNMIRITAMFESAIAMGLTVCRTWAFNDGAYNALQVSPGRFDERVFKGLDRVIVEAQRHGIKLLLSLSNDWSDFGGKIQYAKWAKEAGLNPNTNSNDSFFFDPYIRGYFKNYLKTIITRRNHLTGIEYRDDPTIFAWELMNEPRCESDPSGRTLQHWIEEMASYVKTIDKKHLLTVGLEGFYGPSSPHKFKFNPTEDSKNLGSDFIPNSEVADIDFTSVHIYPDMWLPANKSLPEKKRFVSNWVISHIKDGEQVLKKPVLFTEFGLSAKRNSISYSQRDEFYKHIFDLIYNSALQKGAGAGSFIWQLFVDGMDEFSDEFGVVPKKRPSLYWLLKVQSCRLAKVSHVEKWEWFPSLFRSEKDSVWRAAEVYC